MCTKANNEQSAQSKIYHNLHVNCLIAQIICFCVFDTHIFRHGLKVLLDRQCIHHRDRLMPWALQTCRFQFIFPTITALYEHQITVCLKS